MNKGIVYAGSAYILWGFFPLYFNILHGVPALQTLTHRIVWSFLLLAVVVLVRKDLRDLLHSLTPRILATYLAAAILLAINWFVYVWAVSAGFVVETSLGYFINPLVSVLLGVVILRERLRPFQWVPVGLATVGVAVLAFSYGYLPWISLALAFSFGAYGLVKKIAPLPSLHGLAIETTLLFPLAFIYLLYVEFTGSGSFGHSGFLINFLLALTGIITVIPLLLFASGARRVTLTTLGLLQYTAPTLQFLIGVFVFKEAMTSAHLTGFIVIWIALILFSIEGFLSHKKSPAAEMVLNPME
jgi:chloramphenicol-sensitive protein RarD